jgi:sugar (pentulose or hexulose) kinase
MHKNIIMFDPGTGGNEACIYDLEGNCLASGFVPYTTNNPQMGWHEQCPLDW